MRPEVYWIGMSTAGRLAIMRRPRASDWLDDEVAGWRTEGIDTVVSLLESEEIDELGLQQEAALCRRHGMDFLSFSIPDRDVPASLKAAAALVRTIVLQARDGKSIAIHCRAGIGRSSVIAACILVSLGIDPDAAFYAIGKARGLDVPDTEEQREWVAAFREHITTAL
jgi:protein-tyrosine phosphatase